MPWNALPTLQIIPVRDQDAIRIFSPFQASDFIPAPPALYGVGIARLDPGATPAGTPGTFTMPQVAVLGNPNLPETLIGGAGGPGAPEDAAYDSTNDKLYGMDGSAIASEFHEINKASGATILQITMDKGMNGLEYDESAALFYSVEDSSQDLVTFPASVLGGGPPGATTTVGATGIPGTVVGLAQDPLTNILYGCTATNLYTIDKATGAAALVGGFGGSIAMAGLAFDTRRRILFGVGTDGGPRIYEISLSVGTATLVGTTAVAETGLAYDVAADELLAVASGTWRKFTFPAADAEWNITHDLALTIDGNPNFIDNNNVPTLIVNSTTFPNEDEFYILDVHRIVGAVPQNSLDFVLVYKAKANIDVFDSTSDQIDLATLEKAMSLAGHNARYRLTAQLTGQPSTHEVSMYNPGITDLSLDLDDLDDETNQFNKLTLQTTIDANGDIIESEGTD